MFDSFNKILRQYRIIPVIQLNSIELAVPVADALRQGGLPIAEITLRTDCAIDAIRALSDRTGFVTGAGTVLNSNQCHKALDAGANFIVSPGLDRGVVEMCLERSIPCFPGVATASELQTAFNYGLSAVKFFPAEAMGGVKTLKALAGPFHQMQFVPTGGINASNASNYLKLPNVLAVGGSWMVTNELYKEINVGSVAAATANAIKLVEFEGT